MKAEQDAPTATGPVARGAQSNSEAAALSRRRFVKLNLLGLALAPTAVLFLSENSWAGGRTGRGPEDSTPALLDPEDPQAKALSYTEKSPKDEQECANCQLYAGTDGEPYGPCAIFSYRVAPSGKQLLVRAPGWCRSWGPRQDI
jgi:hypothetical protein